MQKGQLKNCFISHNHIWVNEYCETMPFKFKDYMDIVNVAVKDNWWEWRKNCKVQKDKPVWA